MKYILFSTVLASVQVANALRIKNDDPSSLKKGDNFANAANFVQDALYLNQALYMYQRWISRFASYTKENLEDNTYEFSLVNTPESEVQKAGTYYNNLMQTAAVLNTTLPPTGDTTESFYAMNQATTGPLQKY